MAFVKGSSQIFSIFSSSISKYLHDFGTLLTGALTPPEFRHSLDMFCVLQISIRDVRAIYPYVTL